MSNWSIELGERPLNSGKFVRFFLGEKTSHSFVRIKNGDVAVMELHGLYTSGLGAFFNTVAKLLTGRPRHLSKLRVVALTSPRLMKVFTARKPVTDTVEIIGSEETVLRAAECMVRAARTINTDRPDYYFDGHGGGQTCHSVSAALFRRLGIELAGQTFPYETPGIKADLEKVDPALRGIEINKTASLAEIKKLIVDGISGFSPDLKYSPYWSQAVRPAKADMAAPEGAGIAPMVA